MENQKIIRDYYEMRQGGQTLCSSTVPNLGYPAHWIREMAKAGIHLYKNGKRVKLCEIGT